MQAVMTIGLDIAKSVFQIHGVDGNCNRSPQLKRRAAQKTHERPALDWALAALSL
jgi:hypothetical protein